MTREEKIEILEKEKAYMMAHGGDRQAEALTSAIKALEQELRWIPVTERLPENDGLYLVTEKSGRVCIYIFRKEGNSEEYWERCALAWMPLPEPYKAESEDKE